MCVKFFKVVEQNCSLLRTVTSRIQNLSVKCLLIVQGSGCHLRRLGWLHAGILAKIVTKLLQCCGLLFFFKSFWSQWFFSVDDYLACTECEMLFRGFNRVLDPSSLWVYFCCLSLGI